MAEEKTKERLTYYDENDAIQKRLHDVDRVRYNQAVTNGEREVVLTNGIAIKGEKGSFYISKSNGKIYFLNSWISTYLAPSKW